MSTLGDKIRAFRKRANMSQLELEVAISAATGSVSRIESGDVNPTKETLFKIIDIFHLPSYEAATLFGIGMNNIPNLLKISKGIYDSKNLHELLEKAVNHIVRELGLLGALIALVTKDKDTVQTYAFTTSWYSEQAKKIIGETGRSIHFSINRNPNNLIIRTIVEQNYFVSSSISDFFEPAIPQVEGSKLKKLSTTKSAISLPIIYESESIGAIFFSKDYIDDFKNEVPILETFTDYIAGAINKHSSELSSYLK